MTPNETTPRDDTRRAGKIGGDEVIITLLGSLRFQDDIDELARILTEAGHSVFKPVPVATAEGKPITEELKILLAMVHAQKILSSNKVIVVSRGGYKGLATRAETTFAKKNNIPVSEVEPSTSLLFEHGCTCG